MMSPVALYLSRYEAWSLALHSKLFLSVGVRNIQGGTLGSSKALLEQTVWKAQTVKTFLQQTFKGFNLRVTISHANEPACTQLYVMIVINDTCSISTDILKCLLRHIRSSVLYTWKICSPEDDLSTLVNMLNTSHYLATFTSLQRFTSKVIMNKAYHTLENFEKTKVWHISHLKTICHKSQSFKSQTIRFCKDWWWRVTICKPTTRFLLILFPILLLLEFSRRKTIEQWSRNRRAAAISVHFFYCGTNGHVKEVLLFTPQLQQFPLLFRSPGELFLHLPGVPSICPVCCFLFGAGGSTPICCWQCSCHWTSVFIWAKSKNFG